MISKLLDLVGSISAWSADMNQFNILGLKDRFKIMMLGNEGVGKSSLIHRLIEDKSPEFLETAISGVKISVKSLLLSHVIVRLKLYDNSGAERFKQIKSTYYTDCDGAVVVYDIQDRGSFEEAKEWIKELREKVSPEMKIVLAGNKVDMAENRKVSIIEAESYAIANKLIYIETSAMSGLHVNDCFMELAKALYYRQWEGFAHINSVEEGEEMHERMIWWNSVRDFI